MTTQSAVLAPVQIPLHPGFPGSRVAMVPVQIVSRSAAGGSGMPDWKSETIFNPLDRLPLLTGWGGLTGAENRDGAVEWLNADAVKQQFECANAGAYRALIVPFSEKAPPLEVLRFLIGEVSTYLLGQHDPAQGQPRPPTTPRGEPGRGRRPRKALMPAEALLRELWSNPGLQGAVARALGIARFTRAQEVHLLGGRISEKAIQNYLRAFEREQTASVAAGLHG